MLFKDNQFGSEDTTIQNDNEKSETYECRYEQAEIPENEMPIEQTNSDFVCT